MQMSNLHLPNLYKEDYYIVFDNINLKYSNIAKFNSAIIEFAKFISNSSLFICKLLENGEIIMNNNAIKTGIKLNILNNLLI